MKSLYLVALLLILASCDNKQGKQNLDDLYNKNKIQDARLKIVENELKQLKNDFELAYIDLINTEFLVVAMFKDQLQMRNELDAVNQSISLLDTQVSELQTVQVELEHELALLNDQIDTQKTTLNQYQAQLDTIQLKVTQLELQDSVIELFDPCPNPNFTGYSEVLMRMKSGLYVAYFENSNGQRHLTVLKPGVQYRTTDARSCIFTI